MLSGNQPAIERGRQAAISDLVIQEPQNRSADWFLANPDTIHGAREWCHDHPTEVEAAFKRGDESCIHVEQAYVRILERQAAPPPK